MTQKNITIVISVLPHHYAIFSTSDYKNDHKMPKIRFLRLILTSRSYLYKNSVVNHIKKMLVKKKAPQNVWCF